MILRISRQGRAGAPTQDMRKLLTRAVRLSLLRMRRRGDGEVSLVLTDDPGIQALNQAYRGLDEPTDVLSFAISEGEGAATALLGDIVISTERAAAQAAAYGHSMEREMAFLTVHGMLHLLGMDHIDDGDRAQMEKMQRQILAALGQHRA